MGFKIRKMKFWEAFAYVGMLRMAIPQLKADWPEVRNELKTIVETPDETTAIGRTYLTLNAIYLGLKRPPSHLR